MLCRLALIFGYIFKSKSQIPIFPDYFLLPFLYEKDTGGKTAVVHHVDLSEFSVFSQSSIDKIETQRKNKTKQKSGNPN